MKNSDPLAVPQGHALDEARSLLAVLVEEAINDPDEVKRREAMQQQFEHEDRQRGRRFDGC